MSELDWNVSNSSKNIDSRNDADDADSSGRSSGIDASQFWSPSSIAKDSLNSQQDANDTTNSGRIFLIGDIGDNHNLSVPSNIQDRSYDPRENNPFHSGFEPSYTPGYFPPSSSSAESYYSRSQTPQYYPNQYNPGEYVPRADASQNFYQRTADNNSQPQPVFRNGALSYQAMMAAQRAMSAPPGHGAGDQNGNGENFRNDPRIAQRPQNIVADTIREARQQRKDEQERRRDELAQRRDQRRQEQLNPNPNTDRQRLLNRLIPRGQEADKTGETKMTKVKFDGKDEYGVVGEVDIPSEFKKQPENEDARRVFLNDKTESNITFHPGNGFPPGVEKHFEELITKNNGELKPDTPEYDAACAMMGGGYHSFFNNPKIAIENVAGRKVLVLSDSDPEQGLSGYTMFVPSDRFQFMYPVSFDGTSKEFPDVKKSFDKIKWRTTPDAILPSKSGK